MCPSLPGAAPIPQTLKATKCLGFAGAAHAEATGMSDHFQENRLALLPSSEEKPALACPKVNSSLTDLVCAACGVEHPSDRPQNLCTRCGKPLSAQYDLVRASRTLTKAALQTRERSLWRYSEELPLRSQSNRVSLGEGWTPLLSADRLAARIGLEILYIKDESLNPTGSFKARGMAVAVSKAKELGISKLAAPSAGNAAGALAAYAARAGLEAHLFMPLDTPRANVVECERTGAHVTLMKGLITDCGAEVARRKDAEGWFDVSTLKEPYRLEGKKTLGYELAEQLGWVLPDVILYPTGGRHGAHRNVEGLRRARAARLDWQQAAAHVHRAGRGLRADRQGVRIRGEVRRRVSKCAHACLGTAGSEGDRRFHDPGGAQEFRRRRGRSVRRIHGGGRD
jgi:hypothetical protein